MGRVPYSEFVDARTRFQRLSDQRVFSGWLQHLQNDAVSIVADEELPVGASERFLFQVQGQSADAYFIASLTGTPRQAEHLVRGANALKIAELPALQYDFRLVTPIQLRDSQQIARKTVGALAATMSTRGKATEVLITDASSGGMGIISWTELEKNDVVKIDLNCPDIVASLTCEVRHSRPEQKLIGAYRVGLEFKESDRLSLIAWRKLLNPI